VKADVVDLQDKCKLYYTIVTPWIENFVFVFGGFVLICHNFCRMDIHLWAGLTQQLTLFYLYFLLFRSTFLWRSWSHLRWTITFVELFISDLYLVNVVKFQT